MVKFLKNIILISIILGSAYNITSCDSIEQTSYKGSIQGWIHDDSLKTPVNSVLISSTEFTQTVYTNDSGRFFLVDLSMGTNEHTFQLKLEKTGYLTTIFSARCRSDEILNYDSILIKKDTL